MAQAATQPTLTLNSFAEIIALAAEKRDIATRMSLERDVRLVRCEDGRLEVALERSAKPTLINDRSRKLGEWTGKRWVVTVSHIEGQPTLHAQTQAKTQQMKKDAGANPAVAELLKTFPGAEITDVQSE